MAETRDAIREDDRLQADPEMHEGPAGFSRILMALVGAAFIIGLVLFGLAQHRAENDSAVSQSSSSAAPSAAQNTAPTTSNPADQPAAAARGPSGKEQAEQKTGGNAGQAPASAGNSGQTPNPTGSPAQ